MDELEEQRELLRDQVEHEEAELRQAVEDLKVAVSKPWRVIERLTENPLPWLLSGALIGLWMGSLRNDSNGVE